MGVGVGDGAGIIDGEVAVDNAVGPRPVNAAFKSPGDGVSDGLEQAAAAKVISASAAGRMVRHQAMLHQVRGGPSRVGDPKN